MTASSGPLPPARRGELTTTLGLRHAGPHRTTLRWVSVGPSSAPAVVALGGISAGRHITASGADPSRGWWEAQVGHRCALDPAHLQVIAIDWVGADGLLDVPLDTSDQADAVITVLDHLGIASLEAFVGCSYGALVGLQYAIRYRRRLARLVVVSGAARPNPFAAAYRALQRQVVALGERMDAPTEALALARQLGMLSYRSAAEFASRFPAQTQLITGKARVAPQDYLEARGRQYAERWAPAAFRRLSESIDLHAVDPGAIRVPTTLAAVIGDWLVPPDDVERLAAGIDAPTSVHLIESIYGHDAFLKETEQVAAVLRAGLASAAGTAAA
jgi:homoserine O-acetyltransferase